MATDRANGRRGLYLLALGTLFASYAGAQSPKANPLADAARTIGIKGLGSSSLATKTGWAFKPTPGRLFVKSYVASLTKTPSEQAALEEGILAVIGRYETAAKTLNQENDPATALAFSIAVLDSAAKGTPLDDAAFLALAPRLRAQLSGVTATDRQKQECYEWALAISGMVLALGAAASEGSNAQLQRLAESSLLSLIGAKSSAVVLKGDSVKIVATPAVAAPKPGTTSNLGNGAVAAGLQYAFPPDWKKAGIWTVGEKWSGSDVSKAQIRLVPAVPASGSFGDALLKAWNTYVPEGVRGKVGAMSFRRYVGDGLVAHFLCAAGPEPGKKWDSLWTVYLVDLGESWQPIVVAQTWEDTDTPNPLGAELTSGFSFSGTAPLVETFLRSLAFPGTKGNPLIERQSLIGTFRYGAGNTLQWENVRTGATTMTAVSFGGTLTFLTNGTFTETYSGAAGQVGSIRFRGMKAKGTWTVQGDLLVLKYTEYDQGDSYKATGKTLRIAGMTKFSDGVTIAILMSDPKLPVNAQTVQDRSDWYLSKKD